MADRAPFTASAGRPADVIAARATRQHSLPGLWHETLKALVELSFRGVRGQG